MSVDITELSDGSIHVRIRSKRGTGTRDEDEVMAQALYENIETAESESVRLNRVVRDRLVDARKVPNPPEESEEDITFTKPDRDRGENETDVMGGSDEGDDISEAASPDFSKVYLGKGSRLSGWIPVPRTVIFEEILPRVSKNRVEESEPSIKVNFSEDIPLSGWNTVDKTTVLNEIEPIVEAHRTDRDAEENRVKEQESPIVKCPKETCTYTGSINQVLGHITGSNTESHDDFPVIECPVDGCSYEGTLDSVGGHFHSKRDDEHVPRRLMETDYFEVVG